MTVIDESLTAKGFTPAHHVPFVYGRKRTIESITIHWWGSYGQTHDGINNFFVNGAGQTSAHFVGSGYPRKRINCIVSPLDAAWHAGNAVGNASSVGIELRPEATDADYEVAAEIVRFLRDEYGENLPLIPHRTWQATQCPGNYDLARIDRMAEALKLKPIPKPTPIKPKPPVGEIVDIKFDRDTPGVKEDIQLRATKPWTLKDTNGSSNWNLADEGLGYYDIDLFISGTDLPDDAVVTVQAYIVTGSGSTRNRSGYFTQDIEASNGGKWMGNVRFKSPLLSTARIEVDVIASADCIIDNWGSDTYLFKK